MNEQQKASIAAAQDVNQEVAQRDPRGMTTDEIIAEVHALEDAAGSADYDHQEAGYRRYKVLEVELAARELEDAAADAARFKLFDVVESDGDIRPFHGAWRMDGGTNQLHTAIVPLNLVMRLYWAVVVFVKVGKVAMGADPRQAFVDGYEAALRDGPGNLLEQQKSLEQQEAALREYANVLGERERALRVAQAQVKRDRAAADDALVAATSAPQPTSITPTAG